jgi:hypothetical protein
MRGHKGSTIYKSGLCDLGSGHTVRARNQNKAGPWPGRGRAGVKPRLGWAGAGPRLDQASNVIVPPF